MDAHTESMGPVTHKAGTAATAATAGHSAAHVPTRTYLLVGLFLTAVTALEVAIPYMESWRRFMVPALLLLAGVKFAVVAAYFMHLRFDRRVLTWVFGAGLVLAVAVTIALTIVMAA